MADIDVTEAWMRVGALVVARRDELTLKPKVLLGLAEISATTLLNMRRQGTPLKTAVKVAQLEDAVRWERGSIQQILDGGEPTPLAPGTESPGQSDDRELLLVLVGLAKSTSRRLDGIVTRLQQIEHHLALTAVPSQWNGEERREGP